MSRAFSFIRKFYMLNLVVLGHTAAALHGHILNAYIKFLIGLNMTLLCHSSNSKLNKKKIKHMTRL